MVEILYGISALRRGLADRAYCERNPIVNDGRKSTIRLRPFDMLTAGKATSDKSNIDLHLSLKYKFLGDQVRRLCR